MFISPTRDVRSDYPGSGSGPDLRTELAATFPSSVWRQEATDLIMKSGRGMSDAARAVRGIGNVFPSEVWAIDGLKALINTRYTGSDLERVLDATAASIQNEAWAIDALKSFARTGSRPSVENVERYAFVVGSEGNDALAVDAVKRYFG